MYGNKPPAARRLAQPLQKYADGGMVARMKSASTTQPQRLADGGFVSAAKRMMGLTPEDPARAARLAEYKANAEREKAAAKAASAPATAPAPQAAISQYSGMSAMQRREKEQGLADGGMIRGPGTGTSDSIATEAEPGTFIMPADSTKAIGPRVLEQMGKKVPVRLSNGEYEIPPEQVMGIGAAVLELMKESTHEAAEDVDEGESGDRVAQMLASGGMVENDVTRVGNSYSGGNVGGNITVNGAPTAGTFNKNPASRMGAMPTPPAQPASTSGGLNAPWWSGEYATAARLSDKSGLELEQQRAAAATPGQAPANDPVKRIINTGTLAIPQAVTKPADVAPAAPTAPNPTDQRLSMGTQTAQPTAPALPTASAPAPSAQPAGNEIAPGVYRNAPGQYSDNAQGMNMPAGFTGRPNQQNMAAAANLAASQQAPTGRSMAEAALSQPSGVQAPVVRNSTNDWAARNNLRNLEVSASSITNQPGFSRGGRGYVPPDVAAYQAALQTDAALQQAQPGMDQTAMRENAGIQREGIQQQGATTRTGMQERGSMGRTMAQAALEQQKINQAGESQGFANRAAAQSEQLRNVLLDPNATPEQRAVAQRNLAALSGKTAADRMQTVTLPDTTNEMGQVVRGGQALVRTLEDGSVQQVPIGAQQGAAPGVASAQPKNKAEFDALPKGARFTDPNGQVRIK